MKPNERFLRQPKHFWANVRLISEKGGYTVRGERRIKVPTLAQMGDVLQNLGLTGRHLTGDGNKPTKLGALLREYFRFRADTLNNEVEPRLMDAKRARRVFEEHRRRLRPKCPLPMNKQRGVKRTPAYLTGLVNMLIEAHADGHPCNYDPRALTTATLDGAPLRTLARRVDGAFPDTVNPIAVWETKEYYHTTTFGSRVADGVYETLLDGLELEELRDSESIHIRHYLIVDAHYTWWDCGRSYLCRIFDMLHMGYLDEALFGYEVVERLPGIVREWVRIAKSRG